MKISQIKALAYQNGYTVTKTLKADIITEYMEQQG